MRIHAFQGVRYSKRYSSPGSFAAPPYDQIDDTLRDRLQTEAYSFAHLIRPHSPTAADPARYAAETHSRWIEEGAIAGDNTPALYPYAIHLRGGGLRLGLAALVGLEEPQSGVIRPHERTIAKTVEERLHLTRTIAADLGPMLLLSEDGGDLDQLLAEDTKSDPVAVHQDADQNIHRLYRVTEADRIAAYRRLLDDCAGLIADGHHRYKVARLFATESKAPEGSAAATKLTVITSLASSGLTIDPIHRCLVDDPGLDAPSAAIVSRRSVPVDNGAAFAAAVAAAPQPAIGVLAAGGEPQIWTLDPHTGPPDQPEAACRLPVVLLHHALMPTWGLPPEAAVNGTVLYRSDPEVLWRMIADGNAAAGFFLPPMSPETFAGAVADGHVLPPKSTRFLPKLASGLVWSTHESELA